MSTESNFKSWKEQKTMKTDDYNLTDDEHNTQG